jgi:hypothetical protein
MIQYIRYILVSVRVVGIYVKILLITQHMKISFVRLTGKLIYKNSFKLVCIHFWKVIGYYSGKKLHS